MTCMVYIATANKIQFDLDTQTHTHTHTHTHRVTESTQ